MTIHEDIFRLNRQPQISDWFKTELDKLISFGIYHNEIPQLATNITDSLSKYSTDNDGINTVVLGMSGGIDSAVTAALFKNAGWKVIGVTMPIHQNPEETARGVEACESLGIEHQQVDLSEPFDNMINFYSSRGIDSMVETATSNRVAKRKGNIRARLRMVTLYNLASMHGGIVASTDNFSELAAGFWTLHGDVGDVSPIQSMTKSWEVPALAEHLGVPQSIVEAVPTDGLGIANGDEDQFGFSYLEFDIALFSLMNGVQLNKLTDLDRQIVEAVSDRVRSTTYKRLNPFNLDHPLDSRRYDNLAQLDIYLRS